MEEKAWKKNHTGEIMKEEEAYMRNPGRGMMGEASWMSNH